MCKYCRKHAGGYGKWYLNPNAYSEELFYKLSLLDRILGRESKRVREAIKGADSAWFPLPTSKLLDMLDWTKIPVFGKIVKKYGNYLAIKTHCGQVVPIEDALKIVDLSYDHVVYPCMCQRIFKGKDEFKCLNFGPLTEIQRKDPRAWKEIKFSPEEAKEKLEEFSEKGYIHSVFWWYDLPQSVCICNCDINYCYAARPKLWYDITNTYRKAEYVAEVNSDECISCGSCIERCQYGAIRFGKNDRATIDPKICFGCGQCRFVCEQNAISLIDRNTHSIASKIW